MLKASVDDLRFFRPGEEPVDTAAGIVKDGPSVVLLTDGPRPVRILTPGGSRTVEPPRVEVADSVGAGDAFGGGFLAAWIAAGRGRPDLADRDAIIEATSFAVRVASITCTRPGADPPTATELST